MGRMALEGKVPCGVVPPSGVLTSHFEGVTRDAERNVRQGPTRGRLTWWRVTACQGWVGGTVAVLNSLLPSRVEPAPSLAAYRKAVVP
jgi:hypothetical protein